MKPKLLILDATGVSAAWLAEDARADDIEIIQTILLALPDHEQLNLDADWDYLLIFDLEHIDRFNSLCRSLQIPPERVIYALFPQSWREHPEACRQILADTGILRQTTSAYHRMSRFFQERESRDFMTCTVDGVSYVATSADDAIMRCMYVNQKNFAQDEMRLFHQLSQTYYPNLTKPGWFLDLGANIGTTCIYWKKRVEDVNILAFEPDSMNYRLLLVNLLLNGITENVIAENLGLGASRKTQTLYKNPSNPGGNSILFYENGPSEEVEIVSLDEYLADSGIDTGDIRYIWIDTEGFEAQVIVGAETLLRERPVPLFMELNPTAWKKSGMYEKMMACLTRCYSGYILVPEALRGKAEKHDLQELWSYLDVVAALGQQGDIFLIK